MGEVFTISCQVTYHGRWAPQTVCRYNLLDTVGEMSSKTENATITHTINITASSDMNGVKIWCSTDFSDPLDPAPEENEAVDPPRYEHMHTFDPITVHCKFYTQAQFFKSIIFINPNFFKRCANEF